MGRFGSFEGEVVARWLRHAGDDRDMELLQDFVFTGPDNRRWVAPGGSVVNGASIPPALWTVVGPPFVGDYRRATVIHDVACQQQTEPHEAVHLAFYQAMRADGVGWVKATGMYEAVKRFGPRWGGVDTGGLSTARTAPPAPAELRAFLAAVEQAARELGEDADLEAVERRAETIRRSGAAAAAMPSLGTLVPLPGAAADTSSSGRAAELPLLAGVAAPVRRQMAGTVELREFRSAASGLTKRERLLLIEQALVLIEQNYVHLPLKEAMHAVEPVQRLRLLHRQVEQGPEGEQAEGLGFHHELATIFLSLRDLHTSYLLPAPIANRVAFVPFLVEDFFEAGDPDGRRRYVVTRVFGGFTQPPFAAGVEILRWNGIPIARAVELNADRFAGSNPEARRARGIESLTVRPLLQSLPPDEDFVLVEYRSVGGTVEELRVPWFVFAPELDGAAGLGTLDPAVAALQGIDLEQALGRLARKILFAPAVVAAEGRLARRRTPKRGQGLESMMPGVLEARPVSAGAGELGYVRIRSFSVPEAGAFVREFIRLVEQLPREGLILDVRGNGGGLIPAGEQLLQVLTAQPIEPTLFQLRNTPLNLRLAAETDFLAPWRESMRQSLLTGAAYSAGFPITDSREANAIGQRYHGPVVLITDALCYSTTDIFAASFRDHRIGPILGVDGNLGAGGANVWDHRLLRQLLPGGDSPYRPLPADAGMRVSIRRTIRVKDGAGTVLEDLGVVPDRIHRMTRDDLFEGNPDLIAAAAELLAEHPVRRLEITWGAAQPAGLEVSVDCLGIDRLDVYGDGRPLGSLDVHDGVNGFLMPAPAAGTAVEFQGFAAGALVAARRERI